MKLVKSNQLSEVGVSHDPSIKKKVIIGDNEIPQLKMFSTVTFRTGQFVERHRHASMYEVFYIQQGKAEFCVNEVTFTVEEGDCITIEQGEFHSMSNPFQEEVTWLYFGIATDEAL